jgi:hypothetical protein
MTSGSDDTRPTWTAPTTDAPSSAPPAQGAPFTQAGRPVQPGPAVQPVDPVLVAPPAPASRRSGGMWLNLLLGAAALIAVGGVAFAIGRSTAPAPVGAAFLRGNAIANGDLVPGGSFDPAAGFGRRGDGQGGVGIGPGALRGGASIDGKVTAFDGSTLTITLDSGDEMTFDVTDDTTYHEATGTDAGSVTIGADVSVRLEAGGFGGPGDGQGTARSLTAGDISVGR